MVPDENQRIEPIRLPPTTIRAFARADWVLHRGDTVGSNVPIVAFAFVTEDEEAGEVLICSCCLVKALRELLGNNDICPDDQAELLIALSQGGVDLRNPHSRGGDDV